jgi:hypothetical protein
MEKKKIPLYGANIKISAPISGNSIDTWVYASSREGYQFPYAPQSIKGLSFEDTMKQFLKERNKIYGNLQVGEKNFEIVFGVTGIDYGTFKDVLDGKRIHTISLKDYIQREMPKEIEVNSDKD